MDYTDNHEQIIETYEKQIALLNRVQKQANLGWWSVNFNTHQYTYSETLSEIADRTGTQISFPDFANLIHPEHRERVISKSMMFAERSVYEEEFPLMTKFGYRWVHSKLSDKYTNSKGEVEAYGYLQFIDQKEIKSHEGVAHTMLRNLINSYTNVSLSLSKLLRTSDTHTSTIEILTTLLKQFHADRTYIFEFDNKLKTHCCTYEVVRDNNYSTGDKLKDIPMDIVPWWSERILAGNPIILNNLNELPAQAHMEYELLHDQNIKSLIIAPMHAKDVVWGYIGIDVVAQERQWSNIDKEWFLSLANVINICMELKKSEDKAKKEKEHFRKLYDNMPIGFVRLQLLYDQDGTPIDYVYLEMNAATQTITGVQKEYLIGKRASEINPEMSLIHLKKMDQIAKEGGNKTDSSTYFINGHYYSYTLYPTDDNELIVLFEDDTESIIANRALRHSEEALRNIYKNIPVGIEIYDKNGYMVDMNDLEQEIFGFSDKSKIIGLNLFENPALPAEQIALLRTGKPVEFDFIYDFDSIQQYYHSKYTGKRNIMVKATPLYDTHNNIENYLLIVIDNTEAFEANNKIYEFEILFNSIAEVSEIGICRWNPLTNEFLGSDQWYYNLCCSSKDITNAPEAYANLHPDDKIKLDNHFKDMIDRKTDNFREEARIKNSDGSWKWLRCNYKVSEYDPNNNILQLIGLNIDITELKNTELKLIEAKTKAEESDRLKSAFVANMSHEIRTPLNAIVGFSDLLIYTDDVDERKQYISIIRKNNELLLQLITDILDISKIESGIIETKMNAVDINNVCEEMECSYALKTPKNVVVKFEKHEADCCIITDRSRLNQIISNLIGNAIKFTENGSIKIGYQIEASQIKFYVKDTGIGISQEQLPTIFERFIKLNSFIHGTGLGLPICKSLVEKLGGKIWVESELGHGSCFWFTIPNEHTMLEQQQTPIEKNPKIKTTEVHIKDSRPTILVAEDTDSNYLLIYTILKRDYNLIRAYNGIEAVDLFELHHPALVLMDVRMPEMNGLEATALIRKKDTQTPIVAVTAFAFDSDKQHAFEAGCTEFITKPISPEMLRKTISNLI